MFRTELEVKALDGKPDIWQVMAPLIWSDFRGVVTVPAGFITDLASIPDVLKGIMDVNGRSRRAAVIHDWLYASQPCTRAVADDTLRSALIADGETPFRAGAYYWGVRIGGWAAWDAHKRNGLSSAFVTLNAYRAWLSDIHSSGVKT